MKSAEKNLVQKELEKIYDGCCGWIKNGKILRNKFSRSLQENPKLDLVLKLVVVANIGIWLVLILLVGQSF